MPHYCNTRVLEDNWFNWLIAEATPCLEEYRAAGLLVTKVLNTSPGKSDQKPNIFWGYPDSPRRAHCFVADTPVYCNSYNGRCDKPRYFKNGRPIPCDLPPTNSIVNKDTLGKMLDQGYTQERPTQQSWDSILIDINNICKGISLKFNLPSEDARDELAAEAFVQVINKIKRHKLIFTPGLAPVFNLLTTTIHRIMFSILNKNNKDKENRTQHAEQIVPFIASGQKRTRKRIVTRRVFGSIIAQSL